MKECTILRHLDEPCEFAGNEFPDCAPLSSSSQVTTKRGRLRDQLKPFKLAAFCVKPQLEPSRKRMPRDIGSMYLDESVLRSVQVPARQNKDDSIQDMMDMFVWSSFGLSKNKKTSVHRHSKETTINLEDVALTKETRKKRDGLKRRRRHHKEGKRRCDKDGERDIPDERSCDSLANTVTVSNRNPAKKGECRHNHVAHKQQLTPEGPRAA